MITLGLTIYLMIGVVILALCARKEGYLLMEEHPLIVVLACVLLVWLYPMILLGHRVSR